MLQPCPLCPLCALPTTCALLQALAKQSGARFLNILPSQLQSKWYGDTNKTIRALFSLAQKLQPCIIFIGEHRTGSRLCWVFQVSRHLEEGLRHFPAAPLTCLRSGRHAHDTAAITAALMSCFRLQVAGSLFCMTYGRSACYRPDAASLFLSLPGKGFQCVFLRAAEGCP